MADIKCVLFDFDGVIADTECSNLNSYVQAMKNVGVTLTEEERISLLGASDKELTPRFLKRAPAPVTVDDFRREIKNLGTVYENGELEAYPGLRELILLLRERGILTGVVSSTESRLILTALNRLHMVRLFDAVVCGDMTEKHKPDPLPYLSAMKLLDVSPAETLVIEDSTNGIRSGLASGAKVIAFTGGSIHQDVSAAHREADSYPALAEQFRQGVLG